MLLFVALIGLLRMAAGEGELVAPEGCPEGYDVFGTTCASKCPLGTKENFLFCNTACADLDDPLCVDGVVPVRRRFLFWWLLNWGIERITGTNVAHWAWGKVTKAGKTYLKDRWGRLMPTIDFLTGLISGTWKEIASYLEDVTNCAEITATKLMGASMYNQMKNWLSSCAKVSPGTTRASNFISFIRGQGNNLNACEDALWKTKRLGSNVKTAVMLIIDAAGKLNGLTSLVRNIGRRRLQDVFDDAYTNADGDFEIPVTHDRLERIATEMLNANPETKTWDAVRRRAFVEEQIDTYTRLLRATPEDEEDMTEERRLSMTEDLGVIYSYDAEVAGRFHTCSAEIAVAKGPSSLNFNGLRMGANWSTCDGHSIEYGGVGVSSGITLMEMKDVAGESKVLSFGADFPGVEIGCDLSAVFIEGEFKGIGSSCGVGEGIVPVSLAWNTCTTNWIFGYSG